MKLTKLFSILMLAVVLLGCSSSDDSSNAYNYNKDNLTGTYSLTAFQSKEIKTVKVEGFDVITTIVSTGDTFDVTNRFDSNNVLTMDGTYRVTEVKTQGGETSEDAFIIVLENDQQTYSVNANTSELTLTGKTYKVNDFGRTGFKINFEKTTVQDNGDNTVYTEEWVFQK